MDQPDGLKSLKICLKSFKLLINQVNNVDKGINYYIKQMGKSFRSKH